MPRTLIVGDIHGCYEEFDELLSKLGPTPQDRVISVGDMIGKGPHSRKVLDFVMGMNNFQGVMGNFEWYLVERWKTGRLRDITDPMVLGAMKDMGSDLQHYLTFLEKQPLYLELPECIVVHAGLRTGIPLKDQTPGDLLNLRTVEPHDRPWYESYTDSKLIVHGHWAKQGLVIRENVIGLDTGCVYGKALTALVLPERNIVSVAARRVYVPVSSHP
jgi:serine/threonine protein phosphatase 1